MAGMTAVIEAATVKTDKPFLTGACENGVFRWLREKNNLTRGQVYLEDSESEPEATVDVSGLAVEEFLRSLDDTDRLIVCLRDKGLDDSEVAKAVGLSRQTVYTRLQKIQKKWTEWFTN